MRPWGPGVVTVGLLVLLVLALIESGIVFAISPAPPFDPVAVAGDGKAIFVLNAEDDSIWVMDARDSDAVEKVGSIPVAPGASYLAAGPAPTGGATELAVAGRNDKEIQRFEYRPDGSYTRLGELQLNRPGSCAGEIRTQRCTGVRSLAIGRLGAGDAPALAVGTLGGQARVFEGGAGRRVRLTITLRGNHRIVESVAIGDVDGDARGDLLVRAKGGVIPYLAVPGGGLRADRGARVPVVAQAIAAGPFGPGTVALAPLYSEDVDFYAWTAGRLERAATYAGDERVRAVAAAAPFEPGGVVAATDDAHVVVLDPLPGGPGASVDEATDFTSQQPLVARLVLQALLGLTLAAVAFVAANPGGGLAAPAALGLKPAVRSPVGAAVVAYLAYVGCAIVISIFLHPEQRDVTQELGFGEGTGADFAVALLVIGVAPVSEEVFFRGFMFTGLRTKLPFVVAAAISAGIWGLFHFTGGGSWGVVLQLAVFGLILAWLYERTDSIWPTIAVHALNNALAFAVLTS